MQVRIRHDLSQAARDVRELGRNAEFASVVARTRTALDIRNAQQATMRAVIDRPTGYTLRGLFVRPATMARPLAEVGLKDDLATSNQGIPPSYYLAAQIEGGPRRLKRFEVALEAAGAMPKGWRAVPGRGADLDAHGNISRGQITTILSQLRITMVSGFTRNMSFNAKVARRAQLRAGGRYFVVRPGESKMMPGVYRREMARMGPARRAPIPVLIFVRGATYRRRYDFHGVAERVIDNVLPRHFDAALRQALDTPRGQRWMPRGLLAQAPADAGGGAA